METNILASVKEVVNVEPGLAVFDEELMTHINASFGKLQQLGVGPSGGFSLDDGSEVWTDFIDTGEEGTGNQNLLNMVKTYVNLSVGMLFDPPTIGFLIDAKQKQLREYEWRISEMREEDIYEPDYASE